MCIRDSRYGRRLPVVAHLLGDTAAARAARAGCRIPARLCLCLLYTSDAADERSSVDLGGRRIIKKQNIRYYSRGRH